MDKLIKKKDIIIDKNFDGNCIFNLNINNVEPRDICHPSPTTTGINNILSSLSTFTNLA